MTGDSDDVWSSHETTVSPEEVARAREEAGSDEVVCHECAQHFGQITAQHLRTHRMTLDEYRAVHPRAASTPRTRPASRVVRRDSTTRRSRLREPAGVAAAERERVDGVAALCG